ncbi:hypothetical protein [Pseudoalteromonas xiamenensis]|uniref:Uncharacterized protein n=1 Tax=Pseudoalteromonas xiamenensis TaxID=882626 RepID=A0A975HJX3_9GAMM|nr:hypothetical protein [Pseudoalteromonas xiamenensis]QTH70436.1 hypothetical protein J5O05_10550 [Pseudoalteromonas xiamenensis]
MTFNVNKEVSFLKAQSQLITRKRKKPSKLDQFSSQLRKLFAAGASKAELQRWLARKDIHVQWTTVKRWLDKNA